MSPQADKVTEIVSTSWMVHLNLYLLGIRAGINATGGFMSVLNKKDKTMHL